MIKVSSFTDHTQGEQIFTLTIPLSDLMDLEMDEIERYWISESTKGKISPALMLNILSVLITRIEDRTDKMDEIEIPPVVFASDGKPIGHVTQTIVPPDGSMDVMATTTNPYPSIDHEKFNFSIGSNNPETNNDG